MVVDASSRHPSMVLDPRNRQSHVEHTDHRRVERLGTILNSKGSEHFTARRYQIVQQACPSNEAKYVTLAVYAAHGGDLDHPLVEEHTPPLWIQHTQTVSSMDLPPSTQIEHALLVIQQWAPTSSAQPLELVLPGVSESSGFV